MTRGAYLFLIWKKPRRNFPSLKLIVPSVTMLVQSGGFSRLVLAMSPLQDFSNVWAAVILGENMLRATQELRILP